MVNAPRAGEYIFSPKIDFSQGCIRPTLNPRETSRSCSVPPWAPFERTSPGAGVNQRLEWRSETVLIAPSRHFGTATCLEVTMPISDATRNPLPKTMIAALLFALAVPSSADAGTRCRSTTMGSTTYTECVSGNEKTRCRASAAARLRTRVADDAPPPTSPRVSRRT